jgi:hypothetical protein
MRVRYWNVAEHNHHPVADNPEVTHERSDVSIRGIIIFAIVLVLTAVVVHIGLYGLLEYYGEFAPRRTRAPGSPAAQEETTPLPRLQISPRTDLAEMRAAEQKELTSYGWIDKQKQSVRIPIDQAMKLLAERGLPARKETKAVTDQQSAISSNPEKIGNLKAER